AAAQQQHAAPPDRPIRERGSSPDEYERADGRNDVRMDTAPNQHARHGSQQDNKAVLHALGNDIHAGGKLIASRDDGRAKSSTRLEVARHFADDAIAPQTLWNSALVARAGARRNHLEPALTLAQP